MKEKLAERLKMLEGIYEQKKQELNVLYGQIGEVKFQIDQLDAQPKVKRGRPKGLPKAIAPAEEQKAAS